MTAYLMKGRLKKCINCGATPTIAHNPGRLHPYVLSHPDNTCPAAFRFQSHQLTPEDCSRTWDEFQSRWRRE